MELTRFIIYSVYVSELDQGDNETIHRAHVQTLEASRTPYKLLFGVYKGMLEKSIIRAFVGSSEADLDHKADCFRRSYHQETVLLYSQQDRSVCTIDMLGSRHLGYMHEVPEPLAKELGNYSYRPDTDSYFVISKFYHLIEAA